MCFRAKVKNNNNLNSEQMDISYSLHAQNKTKQFKLI